MVKVVLTGPMVATLLLQSLASGACAGEAAPARIVSRDVGPKRPPFYLATYGDAEGARLIGLGRISGNNGKSWKSFAPTPDFDTKLPAGYRRNSKLTFFDATAHRQLMVMNALDTPGLDPRAVEPPQALSQYYIRYRVSRDGGRTWLFDEPVVQSGEYTLEHPFEGVRRGRNAIYLGDSGSIPIRSRSGRILVAAQATVAGPDGKLVNPYRQPSFTDVIVIIGTWRPDSRLEWHATRPVRLDSSRSTRGVIEPTLAQMPDGRLLMIMRGSNAGNPELPSYRWYSISQDDGETWSDPRPWAYEDGHAFFSPSSMSVLFRHSSGRVFWVGNVSETNCNGNDPRWPVVLGEVDPQSLMLRRASVVELDSKHAGDDARGRELLDKYNGRLDISHFSVIEDRQSRELVITYPRSFEGRKADWVLLRADLEG